MSLFITFEGPEGSGKTTQIRLLAELLDAEGLAVTTAREPGGTRIGNAVRALLLDPAHTEMSPAVGVLLFQAATHNWWTRVIRPALAAGNVVLCDHMPTARWPIRATATARSCAATPTWCLCHRRGCYRSHRLSRHRRAGRAGAQSAPARRGGIAWRTRRWSSMSACVKATTAWQPTNQRWLVVDAAAGGGDSCGGGGTGAAAQRPANNRLGSPGIGKGQQR